MKLRTNTLAVLAALLLLASLSAAPATANPAPVSAYQSSAQIEAQAHQMLNQFRVAHGRPALPRHAGLDADARGWSGFMQAYTPELLWHSPNRTADTARHVPMGRLFHSNENVGRGQTHLGYPYLHHLFVHSQTHRDNMLGLPPYDRRKPRLESSRHRGCPLARWPDLHHVPVRPVVAGLPTLTLWQPWASLITPLAIKTIETRSWAAPEKLIGQYIGIHAAARPIRERNEIGYYEAYPPDAPDSPHPNHPNGRPARLYRNAMHPGMGLARSIAMGASWWPLPLGALLGTARLDACVPMVDDLGRPGDGTEELPDALLLSGLNGHMWLSPHAADVEDQRPYGDFAPGRFAWLLSDAKPTTERCPWCMGRCVVDPLPMSEMSTDALQSGALYEGAACPVCVGSGLCDPIPAKGGQRIWYWTPERAT